MLRRRAHRADARLDRDAASPQAAPRQRRGGAPEYADQLRSLQQGAGNRVVADLVNRQPIGSGRSMTSVPLSLARQAPRSTAGDARPSGGVVQRVLAHDQPIRADEVAQVEQLGGKMVFRLSGRDGNVIVKFEAHIDLQPEAEARLEMTHQLATQVIDNVPGMSPLTDGDVEQIKLLPDNLGEGAALLRRIVNDPHTSATFLCLKKANVSVGRNLRDMIAQEGASDPKKRVGRSGGKAALIARSQQLLTRPAVVKAMGRAAAFDLFIGNDDRFRVQPADTQLENIDFAEIGGALVNLDQFDPNRPLRPTTVWEGAPVLTDAAAMRAYAIALYHHLFTEVRLPDEMFDEPVASELAAGMTEAVTKLKKFRGPLTHVRDNPSVAVSPERRVLAGVFLQRIGQLP